MNGCRYLSDIKDKQSNYCLGFLSITKILFVTEWKVIYLILFSFSRK